MYAPGHISREDEAKIPSFSSHDEARSWFINKYGNTFQLVNSEPIDDQECYFYYLILDEKEFTKGRELLLKNGMLVTSIEYLGSYQSIEIFEDGRIHIVH
ncbi:hypothetical protein JDS99_04635 [Bacillus cereus group sp. N6]|uniref:hypothetical protein n=1 Tax=Bacillus cereus group sp. N6 TaxID=2794583 RepID=UPI0018F6E446|nr:hypothetical protein [Bacillus cereus group sp. N6]MBJ8108950.1 hypothetical protein [Bacillus cereus group sp. N6]